MRGLKQVLRIRFSSFGMFQRFYRYLSLCRDGTCQYGMVAFVFSYFFFSIYLRVYFIWSKTNLFINSIQSVIVPESRHICVYPLVMVPFRIEFKLNSPLVPRGYCQALSNKTSPVKRA